jgi:hypothetical protein
MFAVYSVLPPMVQRQKYSPEQSVSLLPMLPDIISVIFYHFAGFKTTLYQVYKKTQWYHVLLCTIIIVMVSDMSVLKTNFAGHLKSMGGEGYNKPIHYSAVLGTDMHKVI